MNMYIYEREIKLNDLYFYAVKKIKCLMEVLTYEFL